MHWNNSKLYRNIWFLYIECIKILHIYLSIAYWRLCFLFICANRDSFHILSLGKWDCFLHGLCRCCHIVPGHRNTLLILVEILPEWRPCFSLPSIHLCPTCVPEAGLAVLRLGKKREQEKRQAVHQLSHHYGKGQQWVWWAEQSHWSHPSSSRNAEAGLRIHDFCWSTKYARQGCLTIHFLLTLNAGQSIVEIFRLTETKRFTPQFHLHCTYSVKCKINSECWMWTILIQENFADREINAMTIFNMHRWVHRTAD